MKVSIVVPTYNHLEDFLRPCIEKILKYTDFKDKELIVVANGCTDGTKEYLSSLHEQFGSKLAWFWFDEPIGYPKAVNEGIMAAVGEYVVTLDNDSHLLDQPVDTWINMLMAPFLEDEKVGVSSPSTNYYPGLGVICHSGCTMYRRKVLEKVELFDDVNYRPRGFFTDVDVSLRITAAGYKAVQVPEGENKVHTGNFFSGGFPFWHPSTPNTSDKFGTDNQELVEARQTLYRIHKKSVSIIIPTYNHLEDFLLLCLDSIRKYTTLDDKTEIVVVANGCKDREKYEAIPDIKLLWFDEPLGYPKANNEGIKAAKGDYFVLLNDDTVLLDQYRDRWLELLVDPFIINDRMGLTGPVKFGWDCGARRYFCIAFWLVMISKKVTDKIGLLDESFYPGAGEDGDFCIRAERAGFQTAQVPYNDPSMWAQFGEGIKDFSFPIYHVGSGTFSGVGVTDPGYVERNQKKLVDMYGKKTKISFVIPTYNHLEDCLKPCIQSILDFVDFETPELSIEVYLVMNGCVDGTEEYLKDLHERYPDHIKYEVHPKGMGFTWSTNRGLEAVLPYSDYVLFFNNDCLVLPSPKNKLIEYMLEPFRKYPDMGITGPLALHDSYANHEFIVFFCALAKKEVFDKIGILHEDYGIGGGEDIDFCVRLNQAGFRHMMVPEGVVMVYDNTNVGPLPIYHKGEGTMDHIPEYGKRIIKDNGLTNMVKFNHDIHLNLGSGGEDVPGYHSCDKYDTRAKILIDAEDMSVFPDNRVKRILASHLLEHISPYKVVDVLKGWHRILVPGGQLILELPNIEEFCRLFATADKAARYLILNCIYGAVNTGGGDPSHIVAPHLWGWYPEMLEDHLTWAGFVDIVFMPEQMPHVGLTPECNFRCEARKPL